MDKIQTHLKKIVTSTDSTKNTILQIMKRYNTKNLYHMGNLNLDEIFGLLILKLKSSPSDIDGITYAYELGMVCVTNKYTEICTSFFHIMVLKIQNMIKDGNDDYKHIVFDKKMVYNNVACLFLNEDISFLI